MNLIGTQKDSELPLCRKVYWSLETTQNGIQTLNLLFCREVGVNTGPEIQGVYPKQK